MKSLKAMEKLYDLGGRAVGTKMLKVQVDSMRELAEAVAHTKEKQFFRVDLSEAGGFRWENYMRDFVLGIRKYLFEEDVRVPDKHLPLLERYYPICTSPHALLIVHLQTLLDRLRLQNASCHGFRWVYPDGVFIRLRYEINETALEAQHFIIIRSNLQTRVLRETISET